jgi:release factor glutamine methyltransferase
VTVALRGALIAHARRTLAMQLRDAGIEAPELDARILIGHALGLDHTTLAASANRPLTDREAEQIDQLAARRIAHEPVARIVGEKEFWGLPFVVSPAVLVPRPETETVVELALLLVDRAQPLRIADLGTGSGAILLALLSEMPKAHGTGIDISTDALDVAQRNAQRLGLSGRANFIACDFGEALDGAFDLVVSNPPYIASADIAALSPDVREYDPRQALDGGADGLAAYRTIAAVAPRLLVQGGHLVVEIGAGQDASVTELFAARGLAITRARHDLSGIARALAAGPC